MRALLVLVLVAVLQYSGAAAHAPRERRPQVFRVAGREHVRISDWARAHGFRLRWLTWERSLQLSDESNRVVLTINSGVASVNGVQVWLSFPVLVRYGMVYLSSIDVRSTLEPLVLPFRSKPGARVTLVCLDPGHGGKDPGNHVGLQQEKVFALLLAQELKRQLEAAGLRAVLTRANDRFVELTERAEFARRNGADLFVSLHFNSSEVNRSSVRGSEVYCLTPAGAYSTNTRGKGDPDYITANQFNDRSLLLAYNVQKALTRQLAEDRGVRRARFAVLRDAAMPAILVEAGFLSHPSERRNITDPRHRQQLARSIAQGILAHKRSTEQR